MSCMWACVRLGFRPYPVRFIKDPGQQKSAFYILLLQYTIPLSITGPFQPGTTLLVYPRYSTVAVPSQPSLPRSGQRRSPLMQSRPSALARVGCAACLTHTTRTSLRCGHQCKLWIYASALRIW